MTKKDMLKLEARNFLMPLINEHKKLTIFIRHVSRSGMMRHMIVLIGSRNVSYYINDLLGYSHPKNPFSNEYVKVSGCRMDMTFWLADAITYELWPDKDKRPMTFWLADAITYELWPDKDKRPKWLTGNGGNCLDWQAVY